MVAVVAVVVAGVQFLGAGWFSGAISALGGGCSERQTIVVAADPSIAPALTKVAEEFDKGAGNCTTTEIRSQESADTSALFASGVAGDLDAWVPDSSTWLDRAASVATSLGRAAPQFDVGDYIASTPVVFATPASRVSDFSAKPLSWTTLLSGTVSTLLPDPVSSAASLAGLAKLKSVSSPDDPRQFAGAMIALGKTIPPSATAAFAAATAATIPTVVVTTEQAVAAHNTSSPESPVIALYPSDGTVQLTYPFVGIVAGAPAPATASASASPTGAVS